MNFYLSKYCTHPAYISSAPATNLFLSVVIPCFNETELINCLQSIFDGEPTLYPTEILVVINASQNSSPEIKAQNEISLQNAILWEQSHRKNNLSFQFINLELPFKDAGVGLARKIGMDEAVRRFENSKFKNEGVIVCLDADCTVEKNYLQAIEKHFLENLNAVGASIQFAHLYTSLPAKEKIAIVHYELFLRYYVNGLRLAQHPFAFHTIGSSMAVRNLAYQKQGGMNKRKAAEDFYFLQKVFVLGNFTEINSTCVYPSARISERVPFGTGKAVGDFMEGKEILFYNPVIFLELKFFIETILNFAYTHSEKELSDNFHLRFRNLLWTFSFTKKFWK